MGTLKYAIIGSISHGTLLTRDLLMAFVDPLRELSKDDTHTVTKIHNLTLCDEVDALLEDQEWDEDQDDEADWLLNERMFDALRSYAAPYCYFGARPGDGSDFGFWPDREQLTEDTRGRDACVLFVDAGDVWPREFEVAARAAGWQEHGGQVYRDICDDYGNVNPEDWKDGEPVRDDVPTAEYADDWEEACRISQLSPDLPEQYDYVVEVNDHGNVSLYSARSGEEIWSCV